MDNMSMISKSELIQVIYKYLPYLIDLHGAKSFIQFYSTKIEREGWGRAMLMIQLFQVNTAINDLVF